MIKNNNDIFFDKENAYDKAEKNEKLNGVEFWQNNIKQFKDSLKRSGCIGASVSACIARKNIKG